MSEAEDDNNASDTSQTDTAAICWKGVERAVRIDFGKARADTGVGEGGSTTMIQQSDLDSQTSIEAELDQLTYSAYLLTLDLAHVNGNPILSLDSDARVAFVLHHVFGYNIEQSASLVEADEMRFRARLRSAYVQLAPEQLIRGAHLTDIREQYAVV
jgi:hypothetical protein